MTALYPSISIMVSLIYFPTVCIGCPSGWVCCGRAWGHCVCKRPGWNSCCTRVPEPVCTAANAACAVLKEPPRLALKAAAVVVDKSRVILEGFKVALTVAQGFVNAAKSVLDAAIAVLDGVRATYRAGVNALSAITKFALTQIINIREMYFHVKLSVANGGVFDCRVKGVLMGKNINVQLRFDTSDILAIAKSLGERAISGISNFIG